MRSRSAAGQLIGEGFTETYSMKGGIKAWNGETAEGPPEAGMAYFSGVHELPELIYLAWALEDGFGRFYREIRKQRDDEAGSLFRQLGQAEEHHKEKLLAAHETIEGRQLDTDKMAAAYLNSEDDQVMEGNIPVDKALQWASGRDVEEILDFAISLEANALDLYIKMERNTDNESARSVFQELVKEEQNHLEKLSDQLGRWTA